MHYADPIRGSWVAVLAVVVQAVLGGLRVTDRNLALAMTHGILAQLECLCGRQADHARRRY